MGIIYQTSLWPFLFATVLCGGGAAFMIGREAAKGWKPFWQAALQVMLLSAAVRFLHWVLFVGGPITSWSQAQESLISLHYYIADAIILMLFAGLGFRLQRRAQMLRQYGWLTAKAGLFGWQSRESATGQP